MTSGGCFRELFCATDTGFPLSHALGYVPVIFSFSWFFLFSLFSA
jgi:hypothetical protein